MIELVKALVRHLMTFGGGFAVSAGLATDDDVTSMVSALVTIIGIVWSFFDKYKAKKAL